MEKSEVETYILKKDTILYRSSVDICKMFKKPLRDFKEKCEDTEKKGLYFSDSIMVPFGMSFEYLDKFNTKKVGKFLSSFYRNSADDIKDSYFKSHQI